MSFSKWLKANIKNYDLIHVHAIFSYTSTYAMWLARRLGVPYIVRPIGQLEGWSIEQSKHRKAKYLDLVERANILGARAVHFTAESERTQALKLIPKLRPAVIPLGVQLPDLIDQAKQQLRERYQFAPNRKIIVYLSRLHPKKGLELLFEALSKLGSDDWQLLIAGNGEPEYTSQLKRLSAELGIAAQCQFIGFCEGQQKQTLLQGADLFALTSYSENFGISVLEALAAGTPALVSKEVALSTLVDEKQLGYVCELTIKSIQNNLAEALLSNGETGLAARSYVEQHYQWNSIAQKLHQLYNEAINSSP